MSTMFETMQAEVKAVLEAKKHSRIPSTIQKALTELYHAEKFSSETAKKRVNDKVASIRSNLEKLTTREFNVSPMALNETQLDREAYERRVLIHAGLVNELAMLRKNTAERIAVLESRIDGSLSKVPFSQMDDFRRDLVALQAIENPPTTNEE